MKVKTTNRSFISNGWQSAVADYRWDECQICQFEAWCRHRTNTSNLNLYYSNTFVCVKVFALHWRGQKCEGSEYFCVLLSLVHWHSGLKAPFSNTRGVFFNTRARIHPHIYTDKRFQARLQSCETLLSTSSCLSACPYRATRLPPDGFSCHFLLGIACSENSSLVKIGRK